MNSSFYHGWLYIKKLKQNNVVYEQSKYRILKLTEFERRTLWLLLSGVEEEDRYENSDAPHTADGVAGEIEEGDVDFARDRTNNEVERITSNKIV